MSRILFDVSVPRPAARYLTQHRVEFADQRGWRELSNWDLLAAAELEGFVLIVSPYLTQIIEPSTFTAVGIDLAAFDMFAIKSRVHFRRGFDDSGFAKTILLVEPDQPFLGTVRLDALSYRNAALTAFYPYANPEPHD